MAAALGIASYVAGLRRRERLGRLLSILTRDGLVVLIVLLGFELLRPTALVLAASIALLWLLLRLSVALLSSPAIWLEVDRSLGLGDELATWSSADIADRDSAMFAWLSRSLNQRLQALPLAKVREISRVGVGRLRYLLPFVVLLLLLRLLAPLLPPLPEGLLELPTAAGGGLGDGAGPGQQGATEPPEADPGPAGVEPPEEIPEPADQAQEPEGPDQGDADEVPPEPIIEGVEKDESFLLPSFIGAGDSRPGQAPAGGLGDSAAGAGHGRVSGQADPADAADLQRQFERALERALRSRHVPAAERPFVRRYFQALMERGR